MSIPRDELEDIMQAIVGHNQEHPHALSVDDLAELCCTDRWNIILALEALGEMLAGNQVAAGA